MFQPSDKAISDATRVSYAAFYKRGVRQKAAMLDAALPYFRKLLNLPDVVKIRVAGLKSGRKNGAYHKNSRLAEISYRLSQRKALETLAHELIHAEQYHTGRLDVTWTRQGWVHSWDGSIDTPRGRTYKSYRSQPWEVEAFGRQAELANKVLDMMVADGVWEEIA